MNTWKPQTILKRPTPLKNRLTQTTHRPKQWSISLIMVAAIVVSAYGQRNEPQHPDSTVLDKTSALLRRMDSTHRADSIRRVALIKEIENLKGAGVNRQRDALLEKLKQQERQDSLQNANQLALLAKLKASSTGFPVAPFGDTLFMVYTKVGSFSPRERAQSITEKIEQLYDNYDFDPDSLRIAAGEASTELVFKDMVVMSVNELEALWFGKKHNELAVEYLSLVRNAIDNERKATSIANILIRVGAVVLIILGIYLVIVIINRLFRRVRRKIISLKDSVLKGIKFSGYQFLDSDRELRVALFVLRIIRLFIIVVALYIALPLMFSVFPWTRGIAETLIGWITDPLKQVLQGFVNYLPNLFTIIVIIVITRYVSKFLEFVASEIEKEALRIPGFYPDWARPTLNIVKFLLYAFSFIIIFPYLPGSDSPIFQGVSVFLGILFSLGSSTAISNAVAGLVITYMRPFKVGDRVKIGDILGDVIEKSPLVTRIRTIKNEDITVPNAAILSGHATNYTTSAKELGLILHTSVTIGYDVPWKQVHELLTSAALATNGTMTDENHKPFVFQTSLEDFYVSYQLNIYTEQSSRMAAIYSELHQNIQDKFNEAGVEIMSPHYRAARDGNITTIPANYLPKDYEAPTFGVSLKKTDHNANQ